MKMHIIWINCQRGKLNYSYPNEHFKINDTHIYFKYTLNQAFLWLDDLLMRRNDLVFTLCIPNQDNNLA